METVYFNYIVIPLLIFLSRIADVSIGTVRMIFVNKGHKNLAPILGFFEILVWVIAMGKLMENMNSFWLYIIYALGFSAGTYLGMFMDEKFSIGKVMIRLVVRRNDKELLENLKNSGYPITIANGESGKEKKKVSIILSVVDRKKVKKFLDIVNETNPKAFYSIEDMRVVRDFEQINNPKKFSLKMIKKRK
ncbi:DUF2179 domain-containing protein [Candidatus Pacearchaeota archaeon]|nr:DUF2179 domain-containing protein [Candidatus Pacearchaeota archaeon]